VDGKGFLRMGKENHAHRVRVARAFVTSAPADVAVERERRSTVVPALRAGIMLSYVAFALAFHGIYSTIA
jgi:hypothetical protein